MHASNPSFSDFEGPKPKGTGISSVPKDFHYMTEVQQKHAKVLLSQQPLLKAFEILSLQRNKKVHDALRHQKGLRYQIVTFAGNLL